MMKTFWLNFIVVLITMASFQFIDQRGNDDFFAYKFETLSALDGWNLKLLKQADPKSSLKHSFIAQSFIPIVTLAHSEITTVNFSYYLPIHSLIREKDYFLLI